MTSSTMFVPYLDHIGSKILYMGPSGSGQLTRPTVRLALGVQAMGAAVEVLIEES